MDDMNSTETTPTDPATTITPEQAAEMEQQLAAYHAQQIAEREAARAEKLKPLTDLFASEAWSSVRAVVSSNARDMIDEPFFDSLRALDTISGALPGMVR